MTTRKYLYGAAFISSMILSISFIIGLLGVLGRLAADASGLAAPLWILASLAAAAYVVISFSYIPRHYYQCAKNAWRNQ